MKVANLTSKETTFYEELKSSQSGVSNNISSNSDISDSCDIRQFNEFLHLPLCSQSGEENVYQVMLRQVVITYRGTKLIGPWSKPAQTSFLCKNNLRGVSDSELALMVAGVLMGVAFIALFLYGLFYKLYSLYRIFGDISTSDTELSEEDKAWKNPLLQYKTALQ